MTADESQKQKKRWSMKKGMKEEKFILRHWWIFVISRIRSWRSNFNYKGRAVLRGDICERWFSIIHGIYWTRIIRFTNDGGKSNGRCFKATRMHKTSSRHSIRLYPSQNGRCTNEIECQNVQVFGYVYHEHKWPKSWSSMEDPVVPLERNLYGHLLAGLLWERQFEKILLQHGWEKVSDWECLFVHREKGLFLSVYVDDIKLAGKKQNIDPMWKVLNKEVELGEPTSFLDHIYLGCTERQCAIIMDIVDNLQKYVSI